MMKARSWVMGFSLEKDSLLKNGVLLIEGARSRELGFSLALARSPRLVFFFRLARSGQLVFSPGGG